jgi:hypothetical protein
MLTQNVNLEDGSAIRTNMALIDGPTNRKTIRSSSDRTVELVVAHQDSNENKGFDTQRTLVRVTRLFEDTATGATVKAYVQFQMSIPYGVVSLADTQRLAVELINLLISGEDPGLAGQESADMLGVSRFYAGES